MMLLDVENLTASLGGRPILNGISFSVTTGEFVGLIGPNGSGKSTLLRAVLGLIPSKGALAFGVSDTVRLSARERAHQIAYVAQDREIAWAVSVYMLVTLGRAPHRANFATLSARDREIVERAMVHMKVEEFRSRPAAELSGGEKTRVLIARALAQDTPLLVADEPTAGLDPSYQIALVRLFVDHAARGHSVIASMHDLSLAARWCTRLLLIDAGKIVADGPPSAVLTPQTLRDVYGVEAHFGKAAGGLLIQPIDLATTQNEVHQDFP